ncbi:MAG TPA: alpha/beta fold hydrolase [Vicinamibacterales bacterium]|jgi:haloalkane dehalogenase
MATTALAMTSFARPPWLPSDVWPFRTVALDVDRCVVAFSETGRGPILLFYTGIGSFVWRDVMLRLSSDFRCVTLDPPGIGLSGPAPRADVTLQRSARAVTAVIESLDLRDLTLVAHDTGGPPAFAAAARAPERIRGIVGVNTFGWRPSGRAFRGMLAVMGSDFMRRVDLATNFLSRVTSTNFGVGRHLDGRSRRAFREGLERSQSAFHDYLRDARQSDALYDELASAFEWPLGRLPLLTIFGERNDPLGFQPQWKSLFPAARQVVIPKGNHFPMCDDPDFVAEEIRHWHRERVGRSMEQTVRQ